MTSRKKILLTTICILAITASAIAIALQLRTPGINVPLHQMVGQVLAEQTAASCSNKAAIVIITLDTPDPILKARLEGFEKAARTVPGLKILDSAEVKGEGRAKYGPGRGLSGERYLRIVNKHPKADTFVSLIGAPNLSPEQLRKLPKPPPRLIAETRARDHVVLLFRARALQAAVVPRFIFPAPGGKPHTAREWFNVYWQTISPGNAPPPEEESSDTEKEHSTEDAEKKN